MSSVPPPASQPVCPGQPVAAPPAAPVVTYQTAPAMPVAPAPIMPQPVMHTDPALQHHPDTPPQELRVYSHSTFFYWWPVWLTGYIMALVTRIGGDEVQIGNSKVWFHESKNLGVIFTLLFFLVILITNVSLRGMASVVAILSFAFGVLLLAYFKMWEEVLNWMGMVSIYMNMGFYVFFSTLVLIVWAFRCSCMTGSAIGA